MAGVWVFKDGVARLVQPQKEPGRRTVLVYSPTYEVITSQEMLEEKLNILGWVRYPLNDPDFIQFHQSASSVLLISVPRDFAKIRSMHMYDIAVKTRYVFLVRDA
ncbi:flowering-promoting factor 1-like protein 4 [Wolffia australiana]